MLCILIHFNNTDYHAECDTDDVFFQRQRHASKCMFNVEVFMYFFVCMLMMILCLAVCLFGGRELVEGDQKAVRDSSGRCLLFECRVSHVNTHTQLEKAHLHIPIQDDFINPLQEENHNNSCNQALQLHYFPCSGA